MNRAIRLEVIAIAVAGSAGLILAGSAGVAVAGSAGPAAPILSQLAPPPQPARPAVPQTAPKEGLATGRMKTPSVDLKGGLNLNDQQRAFIRDSVMKEKDRVNPPKVAVKATVGVPLPPSLELYHLPDAVVADVPNAKLYRYTIIEGRVVLADPTKMVVIEVLDP